MSQILHEGKKAFFPFFVNTEHLFFFFFNFPQKKAFDPFLVTVASFPCGKIPGPPLTDCVTLVECLIQDLKAFPGGSVVKNWPAMQETWVQFLGQESPLEEEMATRSSILAWRIQWTEEPGRLQSMELQRVRYDLATKQ